MAYRIDDDGAQKETPNCNSGLPKPKRKKAIQTITIKRYDGRILTLIGKVVQVLDVLIGNVQSGATLLDFSKATTAFRAANHLCDLRKLGIDIETQYEKAGDCTIGRYFLREPLTIIEGAAV
jgi:hypothetical protein